MNDYRAEFLWPHEDDSVEEAGYEFANAQTDAFRKEWWNTLLERAALARMCACGSAGWIKTYDAKQYPVCGECGKRR